jgi:alpha-D-ribose 1-methylphosphonate 5-triphosphate synthase subunit PhnH
MVSESASSSTSSKSPFCLQDELCSGVILFIVHHHPLHPCRSDQREAAAVRAAQLDDLLTGEEKKPDKEITVVIDEKSIKQRNPPYTAWMTHDHGLPLLLAHS